MCQSVSLPQAIAAVARMGKAGIELVARLCMTCASPAGFTVSASFEVAMAACAPPIEVARGKSTETGQGAPGSVALFWARAAKAHARTASGIARSIHGGAGFARDGRSANARS